MATETPDRVAAIVDLMSHMFMLAVMLFVIAMPYRPQQLLAATETIRIEFRAYDDGKPVQLGFSGLAGSRSTAIDISLFLSDGATLIPFEESLKFTRHEVQEDRVTLDGALKERLSKPIIALITNVSKDLLFAPIFLEGKATLSNGQNLCGLAPLVIGREFTLLLQPNAQSC
jgi:hypothetical protein